MEAIQLTPKQNPILKRHNSLECNCETGHLNKNKCFSVCDICSERKFLRKSSTKILSVSNSSTFSQE